MTQRWRRPEGGQLVDRNRVLDFTFNNRRYQGYAGDTLASALLANGVNLVGRSFKYHRPRGVFSAGIEEPNALVELEIGAARRPNIRATEIALFDGLVARSQNCWPSVAFDFGSVARFAAPFLASGFYYKTFMGPGNGWKHYEPYIRRAAGLGRAPVDVAGVRHHKRNAFCDVLVAGAGPAGLMAALAASRAGASVLLVDERLTPGENLLEEPVQIDDQTPATWIAGVVRELESNERVTVLRHATVFGHYRGGLFGVVATSADPARPEQLLYRVQAGRAVMATGAIERPLLFADNDRPGVMLAGAVRHYVGACGVVPGQCAVVATNNDSAYATARVLRDAGIEVAVIVDTRVHPPEFAGVEVLADSRVLGVKGAKRVRGIAVHTPQGTRNIACDLVCVSGGWTPTLHLHAQPEAEVVFDSQWGAFVPGRPGAGARLHAAGLCNGTQGLARIMAEGWNAGRVAAGLDPGDDAALPSIEHILPERSLFVAAAREEVSTRGKQFVDIQDDVTTADLALALREGYRSIEHVKRYTTLGMGTDQGRTSNINGMCFVADQLHKPVEAVGTTTFRPPFSPVTLGALAGRESGVRIRPVRYTPMHDWHAQAGAVFVPSALWMRPQYYRDHGRTLAEAALAEATNVRRNVGIADVSTLGKIELQGADVATFLERMYVNRWKSLKIGRVRYGLMLREDGYVFDDGTTSRLGETRYLMTTTTGNANAVLSHMEFYHQMIWPELDVSMTSVTDQWAVVALAGPRSRDVLAGVFPGVDVGDATLPHMGVLETELSGVAVRISRLSFSGERAYEIATPADYGTALWETLLAAGADHGMMPYGLEAMEYLRIEKGHVVVGAEVDGAVTPRDLGMERLCRPDHTFVGARSLQLPVFSEPGRPALAGFMPVDRSTSIPASAQLLGKPYDGTRQDACGHITSVAFSPTLGCPIALGLVRGDIRPGATLHAVSPLTNEQAPVEVTAPVFHDPQGDKLRG